MTALLLDTSSLFFRAFHALPPMSTASGEPTSAMYGLSVLLLKLLREVSPSGIAFARDLPQPTFRHTEYAEYKAGRAPMPDLLRPQWRRLDELIAALGAPSHAVVGFEADDVLATLAIKVSATEDVIIVSGDRDLFQTVNSRVKLMYVGARGQTPTLVDEGEVAARYAVAPASMPFFSALVGEHADNLIGVDGVGDKTASKLVAKFGSADNLVRHLATITPEKLKNALTLAADRIVKNEHLARLRDDLELAPPLVLPITLEKKLKMRSLFEALEFKSLLARVDALP